MAQGGEQHLRRFVACREAGDEAGAVRAWEELVVLEFDRVRGFVELHGRRILSADERQDALQEALERILGGLMANFRGTTMGEWVLAARSAARFACLDVQRTAARRSGHEPGLGEDAEGHHPGLVRRAREEHRRAEEQHEARDALERALAQLGPRRRRVLELTRDGVPAADVAAELDVSTDGVYQLRSRALRDLARILEGW